MTTEEVPPGTVEFLLAERHRLLNERDQLLEEAHEAGVQRNLASADFKTASDEVLRLREQVVWGFYENRTPEYVQGSAGEHELTSPITAQEANGMVAIIVHLRQAIAEEVRCLSHLRSELTGRVEGEAARKFFAVIDRAIQRLGEKLT